MLADDLRALFLFDALSEAQLTELAAVGHEVSFDEGTEMFREGEPADSWWVLLEGRVELVRRAGREEAIMMVMDRPGVWAGGFRAWDDSSSYLAGARGASAGRMLRVSSDALGELVRSWFPFGLHLIEGFFQTVRRMDTMSRQREALVALGTLAAGLAHELNNPASAATRAVDALQDTSETMLTSLVRLAEQSVTAEQLVAIDRLRSQIDPSAAIVDSLAVADREEQLSNWLDAHGVDDAWRIAPALAAAGVDLAWCERAADVLEAGLLGPALEWVSSALSVRALQSDVKESTGRVSALVSAMKSYSQLGRASLQVIDVTEGIDSTLMMLGNKLSGGVTIVRDYAADAPSIDAHPGELNQVWTNLIDNAVDAMDGNGTLGISTRLDGKDLVVEISDTGAGMPPDVQARAFEPFFTTKDIGKGTGLGLDISRRIVVERHHGQIEIDSRPGKTVLRVRLPRQPEETSGQV